MIPSLQTLATASLALEEAPACQPRDLILMNPSDEVGTDLALGDALIQLALSHGCRVSVLRPDDDSVVPYHQGKTTEIPLRHYSPPGSPPHQIKDMTDPLFMVAPVSLASSGRVAWWFNKLSAEHGIGKGDLALLDDMDAAPGDAESIADELKGCGFRSISLDRLGLDASAIGYLPTASPKRPPERGQAPAEVLNVADSLQLDVDARTAFHLAHISAPDTSDVVRAAHFIRHTLATPPAEGSSALYVLIVDHLDPATEPTLAHDLCARLLWQTSCGQVAADHFSKARIVSLHDRRDLASIRGHGRRAVTVVLSTPMPSPLFRAAMAVADEVMTSGDQPLSEALSIRRALPYASLSPRQHELRRAVEAQAREIGGEPLAREAALRFCDLSQHTPPPTPAPADRARLNRQLSSHTADERLRQLLSRRP